MTIILPPEVEAKLRERVAAAGTDVATFVRQAVEEKLAVPTPVPEVAASAGTEGWDAKFHDWMQDVASRAKTYPAGFVVDDSRETLYEGTGE
jgi:hypothetical protein